MEERTGLFGILDGFPAQVMIALGLLLTLLAPVIPECASASRESADADLAAANALYAIDVKDFREKQVADREKTADGAEEVDRDKQRKDLEEFEKKAKSDRGISALERVVVSARADAAGVTSHLYLNWLGRLLLLLGLLVLTLSSEGTQQKVLLVILLVVLFGSITGVNLDVGGRAHLGS